MGTPNEYGWMTNDYGMPLIRKKGKTHWFCPVCGNTHKLDKSHAEMERICVQCPVCETEFWLEEE